MVTTDQQVRRLFKLLNQNKTLVSAAAKAGMSEKTARKYRDSAKLPSESTIAHNWRTRQDPFEAAWPDLKAMLGVNAGLQAKTLFEYLQRSEPGRFADGQLRTLQRRIKHWRATEGPKLEVFFPQVHLPGDLCASDFTHMGKLNITIDGKPFDHLIFHLVLTYSNWETGSICFSETFESFSEGIQNALWKLGGVPRAHRTDRLSAAVQKLPRQGEDGTPTVFTERYESLLKHYGLEGEKTQPSSPNENGDVEQSHYRFKTALDQSLMLRGSRDFASRAEYEQFLEELFAQLNAGRTKRFEEELAVLAALPARRLESARKQRVRVTGNSTINVAKNTYSVNSRLIGQQVEVRIFAETIDVWYAQQCVEQGIERLRGSGNSRIDYRHVIHSLVRKPGAFTRYRYRDDMFPTTRFRIAYDLLQKTMGHIIGTKEYLQILLLAAQCHETAIDDTLRCLIDTGLPINFTQLSERIAADQRSDPVADVQIDPVDVAVYDELLHRAEVG